MTAVFIVCAADRRNHAGRPVPLVAGRAWAATCSTWTCPPTWAMTSAAISTATPAATSTAITPGGTTAIRPRTRPVRPNTTARRTFSASSRSARWWRRLAFFGLAGLAAESAEATPSTTLLVAVAAGAAAMAAVYWMLRGLQELQGEGTVRIHRAVGQHGNVYLRVPGQPLGQRENPVQPAKPDYGISGRHRRPRTPHGN